MWRPKNECTHAKHIPQNSRSLRRPELPPWPPGGARRHWGPPQGPQGLPRWPSGPPRPRFGRGRDRGRRLDGAGLWDQALVRGLAPRVVDGAGQGQHSGPVHPEGHSLALAPLPDPAQLGPVLQQHQVMRRPKTDAAGVEKQIQCRQGARTDCFWHGGKGGTREGFPDPDPPLEASLPRVPPCFPSFRQIKPRINRRNIHMTVMWPWGGRKKRVDPPRTPRAASGVTRGSAPPFGRLLIGGPGL